MTSCGVMLSLALVAKQRILCALCVPGSRLCGSGMFWCIPEMPDWTGTVVVSRTAHFLIYSYEVFTWQMLWCDLWMDGVYEPDWKVLIRSVYLSLSHDSISWWKVHKSKHQRLIHLLQCDTAQFLYLNSYNFDICCLFGDENSKSKCILIEKLFFLPALFIRSNKNKISWHNSFKN